MRRIPLLLTATLLPGASEAHVGHLGEVAGHDHWIAGAALGAAALGALWSVWKGRREAEEADPEGEPEPPAEPAEAGA